MNKKKKMRQIVVYNFASAETTRYRHIWADDEKYSFLYATHSRRNFLYFLNIKNSIKLCYIYFSVGKRISFLLFRFSPLFTMKTTFFGFFSTRKIKRNKLLKGKLPTFIVKKLFCSRSEESTERIIDTFEDDNDDENLLDNTSDDEDDNQDDGSGSGPIFGTPFAH